MKGQNMPNFAELIFADLMSRGDFAELIFADTKYKRLETGLRNGVPSFFCNIKNNKKIFFYLKLKECKKASLS